LAGAAFYDLEGTLVSTNLVHTLSFYARRQQGLMASFKKSATTLLSLPVFAVTDQYSRKVFNDLYFKKYKGQSEDRLRYFAQELFEDVIKPAVFPGTYELIEKSRKLGLRQVVITGALDLSVKPLMEHLGITEYVTNRLEFVNGMATGRLLPKRMRCPIAAPGPSPCCATSGAASSLARAVCRPTLSGSGSRYRSAMTMTISRTGVSYPSP